jgi:sn-1 stearoyl-lipid 9-desaturase
MFFRTVFLLHATWLVNSATHSWGTRRFATRDLSTNSWWVALLTFGEGWHNNHHAHPTSCAHGFRWYEIDTNWYGIWTLKKLGLAWDIKCVSLAEIEQGLVAAPNGRLIVPELAASGD